MSKETIANALKSARLKANMTCKDVALATGKSEKTISAWEHCNGQPDADMLFVLCDIYGFYSVDEMLGRKLPDFEFLKSKFNKLNDCGIDEALRYLDYLVATEKYSNEIGATVNEKNIV